MTLLSSMIISMLAVKEVEGKKSGWPGYISPSHLISSYKTGLRNGVKRHINECICQHNFFI